MAFTGASVHEIAEEIRERERQVGRLAMVVDSFDADEIAELRSKVRLILSGNRWQSAGQTLVMAFSLWICKSRFSTKQAFWQEFERQLELVGVDQNYIRDYLLEPAFFDHNITLWMIGNSRRFVTSLMEERQEAIATLAQVRDFFTWYFRHSLGLSVTPEVLARYRLQSGHELPITLQALDALSDDCRKLARIVELAMEHEVLLSGSNAGWADYCRAVVNLLGPDHDPSKLRIVRDPDALRRVILELQNHRTPAQFLRELERYPNASVQMLGSGSVSVSSFRTRRADEVSYGAYRVQANSGGRFGGARTLAEYRVVPFTWLPLETLQSWPLSALVTPRSGWLGYRKSAPFVVSVGAREVPSRRCYFSNGGSSYLWVGEIVPGQKLVVDGAAVPQAAGMSCEAALRLTHDENHAPCVSLVILKLLAYLLGEGGKEIEVCTSQGERESRCLDPDGALALYRDVRFALREFAAPVTVWVHAGQREKQSTFAPAPALLFSAYTREAITPNHAHRQDGRRFVLFCAPDEQPQVGDGVVLTPVESGTAPFRAWQVEWMGGHAEFSLRVGDLSWHIEQQRYFEAWLEPHEPLALGEGATGLMLGPQQRHGFDEGTIRVATNWTWDDAALRCRFSRGTETVFESSLSEVLQAHGGDTCTISSLFARRLNEAVSGHYGRYTLRFYEAAPDEAERVLAELPVSIVPRVRVEMERRLVAEAETVPLQIRSPRVPLWNPETQNSEDVVTLNLFPAIESLPARTKADPLDNAEGDTSNQEHLSAVPRLKAQVVSGSVALPTLGESLRVAALPSLFGLRLYRRLQNGERWEIAEADWFTLDACSLHVFSGARAMIECSVDGQVIWQGRADEDGQALLDDLSRLKSFCRCEHTTVLVASAVAGETAQSSFRVRWAPRVFALTLDGEAIAVRSSGPSDAAIVLRFEGEVGIVEEILPCTGDEALLSCIVPRLPNGELPRFVTAFGWQGDGDLVPSAHRLTLAASATPLSGTRSQLRLPDEWLRAGVGFSSVEEMERRLAH